MPHNMSSTVPSPFTRPPYPHLQSPTTPSSSSSSAFQSCSSLSSLTTPSSSAPMPSPSAQQTQQPFFGSIRPQQQQSYSQSQQAQQPQYIAEQRKSSFDYRPNRDGAGRSNGETKNLLSEYTLIAEAAKRAQMAVLMRDMEGVEL